MLARPVAIVVERTIAVVAAVACLMMAVHFLRTAEKAYLLNAEIAAILGPDREAIEPTPQTLRTVPIWAGMALALAAAGGTMLCYVFSPRGAADRGIIVAPENPRA